MIDLVNTMLHSNYSSLKVLTEGTTTLNVPAAAAFGTAYGTATIPHGGNSDNLLFQVASSSGYVSGTILPWESNDARLLQYARLDSTNLYIVVRTKDSGGGGFPAFSVTLSYRVLIP